jgi:cell division protein FtsB
MIMSIDIALLVAIFSVLSTITIVIVFFAKLKWTTDLLTSQMSKQVNDINNLSEHIETMDKIVTQLVEGLSYVKETVKEIKERCT